MDQVSAISTCNFANAAITSFCSMVSKKKFANRTTKGRRCDRVGFFGARGSGKLVLLDKLLPRLKENGHRIQLFSQFKIMLDILEDYLMAKKMKFERIDGSITGQKRQQAIARFQDPAAKEPPFVMLLSTRAGDVGIYMEHLVTSPEAQSNTSRILKDMGRIYQRNFGSTLEACNISKT